MNKHEGAPLSAVAMRFKGTGKKRSEPVLTGRVAWQPTEVSLTSD